MPQIDRIRWHLFPEIRVTQGSLLPELNESGTAPDFVRVMDLRQEQLARSLGEGHRVIHGVAGSGKTMILGYRVSWLAQALDQPILVLCYNVALAAKLRQVIADRRLSAKVSVYSFHAWCMEQLRLYHVDKPASREGFSEQLVEQVIRGVDAGRIPRAQYGAVMIDEGHDFEPAWLKLVAQMVDPQSNSLLVLYDDAQSIYGERKRRKFSFASVGIEARGRTTILRLNYRNTAEVLAVAYEFARDVLTPEEAEEDGIPLVAPESAGRHGPVPQVVTWPNLKSESSFIANRLKQWHETGRRWNEMGVLYRVRFVGEEVVAALRAAGIPFEWLQEGQGSRRFDPNQDSVKVMTMHSSKGLEFPVVAIPGLGFMPHEKEDPHDEARLLYVAMTRAMDELVLTCHRKSAFAAKLNMVCERGRSPSHPNRFFAPPWLAAGACYIAPLRSPAAATRAAFGLKRTFEDSPRNLMKLSLLAGAWKTAEI
jgi:superfamily I DNA/RNA helicase